MMQVTESLIEEMVSAIVREASPEQIVLFGSRASGQASPDSDVDLLVVESDAFDAGRSRRRETARLLEALARFAVPIEVLVYSRAEVEQWRHSLNNVVGQAIRKGTVIYERPASGPLAA